jgi:hypothetical protein
MRNLNSSESAAVESFRSAEDYMNRKWGWYAWQKMTTPEMAAKYRSARQKYMDAMDGLGDLVKCCDNLVRGLKVIDGQLLEERAPDDVFYLTARVNKKNYYFVSDQLDMQRIIPLMKGKDPIVYTLQEIVTILEADKIDTADLIKQNFPGAFVRSIEFKHNQEQLDDEIPF